MTDRDPSPDPLQVLFVDPGAVDDPAPAYARLLEECPVARTPGLMGEMTVWVSGYDAALWALKHPDVFSSAAEAVDIGQQHDLIPLQIDAGNHCHLVREQAVGVDMGHTAFYHRFAPGDRAQPRQNARRR